MSNLTLTDLSVDSEKRGYTLILIILFWINFPLKTAFITEAIVILTAS